MALGLILGTTMEEGFKLSLHLGAAEGNIMLFFLSLIHIFGAQHGLEHDMGEIHAADIVTVSLSTDQPRPADLPARAGLVG